jgi:phosphohistidine phosphatase
LIAVTALFSDKMTLILTVVRHAQSAGKQSGQHDFDRVLTEDGMAWAQVLKNKLPAAIPPVDIIIASSAKRVRQTVQPLLEGFALAEGQCHFQNELYEATARDWLATLQPLIETQHHILLAGHNPVLSHLVSGWTCQVFDLHPGQAISLEFQSPNDLRLAGMGTILYNLHE